MRKIFIIVLLLSLSLISAKLELYTGKVFEVDSLWMKGDTVYTGKIKLSRNNIKSIIFGVGKMETGKSDIESDVKEILERRRDIIRKYSNFPGVIMLDKGRHILHDDGTRTYIYHHRALILKDSKRVWGNFHRVFQPDMEKFSLEMARVIKPDGRIIPLDMDRVTISKARQGKVFFGKDKIISFSLPGVEVGDVIEYKFREEIFNPWDPNIYSFSWFFGGQDPVIESEVDIVVPREETIKWSVKNIENPQIDSSFSDSTRTYTFRTKGVKPPIEEPFRPAIGKLVPTLRLSNQDDWSYIFNWYSNFQKKRMNVTPEIKRIADSLTSGDRTEKDITETLYHWIQRNVRYISIKGAAASGVSGHSAEETLENGYGDCTDKAILFSTLLKSKGIEAYPVYLHTHPSPGLDKNIPSFWGNHAIVEIFPENGEPYFLDPVSEYSRYPSFASMDHGVWAITAQRDKIERIPVPPPEENRRNYNYVIEINEDGSGIVKFHSHYNGSYESGIRAFWESLNPEEKKKQFQQMAKRTSSNAELLDYSLENLSEISKPLHLRISYKVPELLKKQGELFLLKLPEISDRYRRGEISLSARNYDLVYDTSEEIVHEFDFILPANMKIISLPEDKNMKKNKLEYNAAYQKNGNKLIFRDDWRRKGRIIENNEYSSFKSLYNEVLNYVKKPVILKKRGED